MISMWTFEPAAGFIQSSRVAPLREWRGSVLSSRHGQQQRNLRQQHPAQQDGDREWTDGGLLRGHHQVWLGCCGQVSECYTEECHHEDHVSVAWWQRSLQSTLQLQTVPTVGQLRGSLHRNDQPPGSSSDKYEVSSVLFLSRPRCQGRSSWRTSCWCSNLS